MSAGVESFLLTTLAWTAALIALVLVLRRPVARYFGPQAAYALWLLPFLRLLLPPIELPGWLARAPAGSEAAAPTFVFTGDIAVLPVETAAAAAAPAAEAGAGVPWGTVLLAIWLGGAAVFLVRRFQLYFRMRRELLDDTVPVGEAGKVRLVETPAATSPVAFGVIDKVVALPSGFMATHDRAARDLALEHELAHHRGHDLLANFAAQPLFALHWFNPLAWIGWRAMRRDQEAACDARVVSKKPRGERAAYAEIIAGFAAGPNIALAAPMACPVLGDKSIIHRLRSLNMSEISPRRRAGGRALLGAAILALPLTASITYAESLAPPAAPTPPLAVLAPAAPPAPAAPAAAAAPPAPPALLALQASADAPRDGERRVVIRTVVDEDVDVDSDEEGQSTKKKVRRHIIFRDGEKLSDEERARIRAELKEDLADMEIDLADAREAHKKAIIELRRNGMHATRLKVDCNDKEKGARWSTDKGQKVRVLCTTDIEAQALAGLRQARDTIAKTVELDEEIREQVLEALDKEIARWSDS